MLIGIVAGIIITLAIVGLIGAGLIALALMVREDNY